MPGSKLGYLYYPVFSNSKPGGGMDLGGVRQLCPFDVWWAGDSEMHWNLWVDWWRLGEYPVNSGGK